MKLAIVFAALALATPAPAALPDAPPELVADGYFEVAQKVADKVWVIRQAEPFHLQPIGNVTVVEQADGLVMVDAGGSPGGGRRLVGMIRALSPKPVKAVILTHWHGDHPQGLPEIQKAWPQARTISTAATKAALAGLKSPSAPFYPDAERNAAMMKQFHDLPPFARAQLAAATTDAEREGWRKLERLFLYLSGDMDEALTPRPKETFTDRLDIPDPETPVEARFLGRANTDGDAVVWLPNQRVLVAGDIVVSPVPYGFGSYPQDWIATLGKVKAYDFAVLIPGHGAPQSDKAYLDRLIALLEEVRRQVAPRAAAGLPLKDVQTQIDLSTLSRVFAGGDAWRERWFDQYWTKPIVASAYKEARGEPIRQGFGG